MADPTLDVVRSPAAAALVVRVQAAVAAVRREGDLSVKSETGQRLARAVCEYVRLRRDEGALPERVIVELKSCRSNSSQERPDWRMANADALTAQLIVWCLAEYFPAAADPLPE